MLAAYWYLCVALSVLGHSVDALQRELKLEGAKVVLNDNFLQGMRLLVRVFPVSHVGKSPACLVVWMDYIRRHQVSERVSPS